MSRAGPLGAVSAGRHQIAPDVDVRPLAVRRQPHPAGQHATALPGGRQSAAAAASSTPGTRPASQEPLAAAPGLRATTLGGGGETVHTPVPRKPPAASTTGVGPQHQETQHRV